MSVRDRLDDGRILWELGRTEGAWIQVLIAAAATAKTRYPAMRDGEDFTTFILDVMPTLINPLAPALPGKGITIVMNNAITLDHLIYKHLRCFLIHEATIDEATVKLVQSLNIHRVYGQLGILPWQHAFIRSRKPDTFIGNYRTGSHLTVTLHTPFRVKCSCVEVAKFATTSACRRRSRPNRSLPCRLSCGPSCKR